MNKGKRKRRKCEASPQPNTAVTKTEKELS